MSQRWLAFVVASAFASGALAQSGQQPTSTPAAEVPAPPPATAPKEPAPSSAPQVSASPSATPAPAPTAVPPATPSPAPADSASVPAAPAPTPQTPPPPPTFPQGASEPPSTTSSVEVTGQGPQELPPPPPPPEPLGIFGLTLSFGFAFGGDEVAAATYSDGTDASIRAGTGGLFGIGVVLMPFRREGHSFGVAVDQSVKFTQISARNASIALTRFPLVASLRYDYAFTDTWHLALGGGVVYEYGISLTGDGDFDGLDLDIENALGWMGEAGVAYRERSFVIDATLRFTSLTYQPEDERFSEADAKNGGLVVAGHYFF
jgi:hypothetical protein